MIKRFTLVCMGMTLGLTAMAQQDPQYSHFSLNKVSINPAAAGITDNICVNGVFRRQYSRYRDFSQTYRTSSNPEDQSVLVGQTNPKTEAFNVHARIPKLPIGVGLSVINDKIGFQGSLVIRGNFNYQISLDRRGSFLSLGVDLGMAQRNYEGSFFNPLDPGDPQIPVGAATDFKFDAGFGAYYSNPQFNNLWVGVSTSHLTAPSFQYQSPVQGAPLIQSSMARHLHIMGGIEIFPMGPSWAIQPAVYAKFTNVVKPSIDLNVRAVKDNKLALGFSYRTGPFADAFVLMGGMYVRRELYVGYAYDINFTNRVVSNAMIGSHELIAQYCFSLSKPVKPEIILRTPRFL